MRQVVRAAVILLPIACLASDVAGDLILAPEAARHADARRLLEALEASPEPRDEATRRALAVSRRLFDFGQVTSSIGGAVQWAQDTASQVQNQVVGLTQAVDLIGNANVFVDKGVDLTGQAWTSMLDLGTKMKTTYDGFKPLEPVFASRDGMVSLTTDQSLLTTLVHSVREIISSNSILNVLGAALEQVIQIFTQIKDTIVSVVTSLSGGGRRLSGAEAAEARRLADYSQLLEGIDFDAIGAAINGFVANIKVQAENLVDIDTVLGPMLAAFDSNAKVERRRLDVEGSVQEGWTGAVGGLMSLNTSIKSMAADANKNARAISKIIPTWQAVETNSVSMCPSVLSTKDTISNLQCRTTQFASQAGLSSWVPSQVTNIIGGCPADLPDSAAAVAAGCPKEAYSENIKDVLGENSQTIGWGIVVASALGAAGVGGGCIAGMKKMFGKEEEETETEGEDEDEEEGATLRAQE